MIKITLIYLPFRIDRLIISIYIKKFKIKHVAVVTMQGVVGDNYPRRP